MGHRKTPLIGSGFCVVSFPDRFFLFLFVPQIKTKKQSGNETMPSVHVDPLGLYPINQLIIIIYNNTLFAACLIQHGANHERLCFGHVRLHSHSYNDNSFEDSASRNVQNKMIAVYQ